MTDPISNEKLAEMLADLEGVTPGPWRAYRHPQHAGQIQIGAGEIEGGGDGWDEWCVAATFEASEPGDLDANHIARCDPDTIRSLIEEVQASRRQSPAGIAEALRELVRCVRGGDETAGFSMDDALEDADAALSSLSVEPAGVEPVSDLIQQALRELDNVTALNDQDANCLGCAENLLRQALAPSPPKAVTITDAAREAATALQSQAEQIERLTRERDVALENYTRAWNERDAQRRRAVAAEARASAAVEALHDVFMDVQNRTKAGMSWGINGHPTMSPASLHKISQTLFALRPQADAAEQLVQKLTAENERLREALTPSGDTKAEYAGEFSFRHEQWNVEGDDTETVNITVPWTTIKEIMAAIRARSALTQEGER